MSLHTRPPRVTRMLAAAVFLLIVPGLLGSATGGPPGTPEAGRLGDVRVHRYTMSGAVRPLLFWISRDGVGLARVTWRRGSDGTRGYELLVGTDPAQAPRGINRWGYILEAAHGEDGSVLALMAGSPDTSYEDESSAAESSPAEFRALRGALRQGGTSWQVARVRPPAVLTIHDLDEAIGHVARQMTNVPPRAGIAPAGARPGFLVAVAEAIDRAVGAGSPTMPASSRAAPIAYVFGRDAYELRLRDSSPVTVVHGGRPTPALRLRFECHRQDSGSRTRFDVVCATGGELAGVPLVIEWQPRWWLRATLRLED